MSAEIIPFVPRPRGDRGRAAAALHQLLFTACPDDLVLDHADTAPCEYLPWCVEADEDHAC